MGGRYQITSSGGTAGGQAPQSDCNHIWADVDLLTCLNEQSNLCYRHY